jgi:hypothetical protein
MLMNLEYEISECCQNVTIAKVAYRLPRRRCNLMRSSSSSGEIFPRFTIRSSHNVAEHTTLESFEEQKHEKEAEIEKEETVKILVQFSRIIKDSRRRTARGRNS